jgi:APA family basic amino acid/polyamine antiporter
MQVQEERAQSSPGFRRTLSALNLTTLGIGAIMGAGIFIVSGRAAAESAGPAIALSFGLSGAACAFAALCYAEMAAAVPQAGSAYLYTRETLGRFVAWIIGWDLILEYSLGAATVAVSWSAYFVSLLREVGVSMPAALASAPLAYDSQAHVWTRTGAILNVPAVIIIAGITWLLVIGIRESSNVNTVFVVMKLVIVMTFIVAGAAFFSRHNWITATNPEGKFIPPNLGAFGHFGWSGVLRGCGIVFFAFIGFDAVSAAAQEAHNPKRDVPIGILASLAVCTVLYALVAVVLTGIIPYDRLEVPDPLAVGVDSLGMNWLNPMMKVAAVAGLSSVVLVLLLAQPRILFAMARDGLLPRAVATLHPRFQTPYLTTIGTGIVLMLVAGFLPLDILGDLVSLGTLLAFAIVCAGVLVLRVTQPNLQRPFRVPFAFLIAPAGVVCSTLMMVALPPDTWRRLLIWIAGGILFYLAYGRTRGRRPFRLTDPGQSIV